jgi:RND family efflux transporter MFP subunit
MPIDRKRLAAIGRSLLMPALLGPFCGCADQPARQPPSASPREVPVAQADRTMRPIVTEVVGTVRAVFSATMAPLISGTVAEMRAGLGSRVRAGEVLVRLFAPEVEARLEQSRAESALAERERDRATKLRDGNAITAQQYEAIVSQWRIAQARETEASSVAEHAILRAPFAGVVTAKLANVGDTALAGRPLLVVEAPGALRFEALVPETAGDVLQVGQSVPVRLDGVDHDLQGTVVEIQPASDDATRTRLIKVDLPRTSAKTPGLRAGRFGRLMLTTGASPAVSVPAQAVLHHGQLDGVFVVDGGTARLRLVRVGRAQDGRSEIISGLSGGEKVVLDGAADLVDGQRVEVSR